MAGTANAQSATDWSGLYAGVSWMKADGSQDYLYGGEIAYAGGEICEPDEGHEYNYDKMFDFKGRIGVATGAALFYVSAGYSSGSWHEDTFDDDATGSIVGLGVDYQLGGNYFVGAEWNQRKLKGNWGSGSGETHEDTFTSMQIRGGLRF